MAKRIFLAAAFLMTAMTISASAQKTPDFSGTWTLDVSRSKLAMPVESMTMWVSQTDSELTVRTETKRAAAGGAEAPRGGAMRGGGGPMGGGDMSFTYSLDGKDRTTQSEGPMGPIPVTLKAKFDNGKLKLSQTRNFESPMGSITMVVKETWEIGSDGTLTISRESQTPRGNNASTLVFTKKS